MSAIWTELDAYNATNTAVAVGSSEIISNKKAKYSQYNRLIVQNMDVVDIEIRLDALNVDGKIFRINKNGGYLVIEPEAGIYFRGLQNVNLSSTDAESAGKILFRFSYASRVD